MRSIKRLQGKMNGSKSTDNFLLIFLIWLLLMNVIMVVQRKILPGGEVLAYFTSATHIGLTATPRETKEVSNFIYFGEPIYTYSLKQGVEDDFLAPYKVIRSVTRELATVGLLSDDTSENIDQLLLELSKSKSGKRGCTN